MPFRAGVALVLTWMVTWFISTVPSELIRERPSLGYQAVFGILAVIALWTVVIFRRD